MERMIGALRPQRRLLHAAHGLLFAAILTVGLAACAAPSKPNLAPLLVVDGDLAAGIRTAEIVSIPDAALPWPAPAPPRAQIDASLVSGEALSSTGTVHLWSFDTAPQAIAAYEEAIGSAFLPADEAAFAAIGERRALNMLDGTLLDAGGAVRQRALLFTRCQVLVEVRLRMELAAASAPDAPLDRALGDYAGWLDKRLATEAC